VVSGKFAGEVIALMNRPGDIEGCRYQNGVVTTPAGAVYAYRQFIHGGWGSLPFDPELAPARARAGRILFRRNRMKPAIGSQEL
jgi:hypothetical protein